MLPTDRALWYIESHLDEPITLDTLAAAAGISRYHLSRSFGYAFGMPIRDYLRRRRLSMAATALAAGETRILDLALSLGFGSHEAFTRAFRDCFGCTPETVRTRGHTNDLTLTEARLMSSQPKTRIADPEIWQRKSSGYVGLNRRYSFAGAGVIPGHWQAFTPQIPAIRHRRADDPAAYGIIHAADDDGFEYLCAMPVTRRPDVPGDLHYLELPEARYAVFRHEGHIAGIRATCNTIWSQWLPASTLRPVEAPWFERYPPSFDPATGLGGVEIWIPVEPNR